MRNNEEGRSDFCYANEIYYEIFQLCESIVCALTSGSEGNVVNPARVLQHAHLTTCFDTFSTVIAVDPKIDTVTRPFFLIP